MRASLSFASYSLPIASLDAAFPSNGRWNAFVVVPTDAGITEELDAAREVGTACILAIGDVELKCVVNRLGTDGGNTAKLTLVGGSGGLGNTPSSKNIVADPRSQIGNTVQGIADWMLASVGEGGVDASLSSSTILKTKLKTWQINAAQGVGTQLTKLCSVVGARWQVGPSGGVIISAPAFPDIVLPPGRALIDRREPDGTIGYHLTSDIVDLPEPGFLADNSVIYRETNIVLDETSARLYLREQQTDDRLASVVRTVRNELVYVANYSATVSEQKPDGTFVIKPDDLTLCGKNTDVVAAPGPDALKAKKAATDGIANVEFRPGIPGITVKNVAPGTRCTLSYDSIDPTKPYISSFYKFANKDFLVIYGDNASSFVADGKKVDDELKRIWTYIKTQMIVGTPTGPSSPGVVNPPPDPQTVQVKKLKSE